MTGTPGVQHDVAVRSVWQDDHRYRAPEPDVGPVDNTVNTADDSYEGSWVAEVTIVNPNGDIIRSYKNQERHLIAVSGGHQHQLPVAHAHTSAHAACALTKNHVDAASLPLPLPLQMQVAKAAIKRYSGQRGVMNKLRVMRAERRLSKLKLQLQRFEASQAAAHSSDCVCAFVVFNCVESKRRCLEDYDGSTSKFGRLFQVRVCVPVCHLDVTFSGRACADPLFLWRPHHVYLCLVIAMRARASLRRCDFETAAFG
jgi:hypothetical protein